MTAFVKLKLLQLLPPFGNKQVRLAVAGHASKMPGMVAVALIGEGGADDFLGRLLTDGAFQPHKDVAPVRAAQLTALLGKLAADPASAAAKVGNANGCCCGTALVAPDSTRVGYGPVCAK